MFLNRISGLVPLKAFKGDINNYKGNFLYCFIVFFSRIFVPVCLKEFSVFKMQIRNLREITSLETAPKVWKPNFYNKQKGPSVSYVLLGFYCLSVVFLCFPSKTLVSYLGDLMAVA